MAKFARSKSSNPIHDQSQKAKSVRRKIDIARQVASAGRENLELHTASAKTCHVVRQLSQTHAQILGLFAYEGVSRAIIDPESLRTGCGLNPGQFSEALSGVLPEFVEEMKPRDALEKLALEQLMIQHARVLSLARQASASTNSDVIRVFSEACDGASSSFRRLMTSFLDHRRTKIVGVGLTQSNLANQQIIQNLQIVEAQNAQNQDEQTKISLRGQAAVSTQPERPGIITSFDNAPAALGAFDRTANGNRKIKNRDERPKARRAVDRKRRAPEAGEGGD